jgi:hypothetical protein
MNAASLSPAKGRKIADYNVYGFVQRADHAGCGYIGAVCAISKWVEGSVVPEKEQIKIAVGEGFMRVPLVARARGRTIVVQFLLGRNLFVSLEQIQKIKEKVRKKLNFYRVEKCDPNPWAYAISHCNTAANVNSPVLWGYYKGDEKGNVKRRRLLFLKMARKSF